MTKAKALHNFFNSFGIPFYTTASVPDDAVFPWGTYELVTSAFELGEVGITVNLWYRTESEAIPNAKAQEIADRIASMDPMKCDGGLIWLKMGNPWCQSLADDTDPAIKRRYINVTAEYLTTT